MSIPGTLWGLRMWFQDLYGHQIFNYSKQRHWSQPRIAMRIYMCPVNMILCFPFIPRSMMKNKRIYFGVWNINKGHWVFISYLNEYDIYFTKVQMVQLSQCDATQIILQAIYHIRWEVLSMINILLLLYFRHDHDERFIKMNVTSNIHQVYLQKDFACGLCFFCFDVSRCQLILAKWFRFKSPALRHTPGLPSAKKLTLKNMGNSITRIQFKHPM